jgi:hypothetical protein
VPLPCESTAVQQEAEPNVEKPMVQNTQLQTSDEGSLIGVPQWPHIIMRANDDIQIEDSLLSPEVYNSERLFASRTEETSV